MTIKLLIVDPEIGFAIPVKRALEDSGDYTVNVFANGMAAVEFCQRQPQDVVILDFRIGDMTLPRLIKALRAAQPGLFILSSPRTIDDVAEQPLLDVQGSISKPYFARQLVPILEEALKSKAKHEAKQVQEQVVAPEPQPADEIPAVLPEPPIEADDTFHRLTAGNSQELAASVVIEEPPIDEEATIRDLVSGQTAPTSTVPTTLPEAVPEPESPEPAIAVMALDAVSDDTVLLEDLALPKFIGRLEEEMGDTAVSRPMPAWVENTPAIEEPEIYSEDTQPSERLRVKMLIPPVLEGDTGPTGQIAQQPVEAEQESTETPALEPIEADMVGLPEPQEAVSIESVVPPVATLAVQLTQLTVDSAAEATLVTQGDKLIASAGDLPEIALAGVVDTISSAWADATEQSGSLVRFVHLPGLGDYLLYSTTTIESMILSMLFPAETPLKAIRKQARELIAALERVPEVDEESEAAKTLISRPTDLRPPAGLREASAPASEGEAEGVTAEEAIPQDQDAVEGQPPRAEGPYTAYAFVWLPRTETLDPDIAGVLLEWVDTAAKTHAWQLDDTDIQPSYVSVQISIPANETPTATVESLMHETSARSGRDDLWADAYYIVAPGRAVTEQEIASFMEYRREAQDAA